MANRPSVWLLTNSASNTHSSSPFPHEHLFQVLKLETAFHAGRYKTLSFPFHLAFGFWGTPGLKLHFQVFLHITSRWPHPPKSSNPLWSGLEAETRISDGFTQTVLSTTIHVMPSGRTQELFLLSLCFLSQSFHLFLFFWGGWKNFNPYGRYVHYGFRGWL